MKNLFFVFVLILIPAFTFGNTLWNSDPLGQKNFVENQGQFDGRNGLHGSKVFYGASCEGVELFFSAEGLIYRHDEYPVRRKEKNENEEKDRREEARNIIPKAKFLNITWEGSNPNVQIVAEEEVSYYYTYPDTRDMSGKSSWKAPAFKKITYKGLYPSIDIEYTFPEGKMGIKYSIILHPGADPSVIKMKYEGARKIFKSAEGNVVIKSTFGEFVDHAPQIFYSDNGELIPSSFTLKNDIVSFELKLQTLNSQLRTVVVDPWVTNPAFPGYNAAYDVEFDYAGNVYVYGGACPYIEVKMNSAGAIQWIFTATQYTFAGYYGDFCVDPSSGTSYVCEGAYWPWTGSRISKVNGAGAQTQQFPTGNGNMRECWRVVFDNCNKRLVLAGSSFNNSSNYQGFLLDTNFANLTSVNVLAGTPFQLNEQDMCMLAIDNSNNVFMGDCGNKFLKVPAATLVPTAYVLPNNHVFTELMSIAYIRNITPSSCGMNGMAASNKYVYTYDGGLLQRWDKNTGAFKNGTTISATKFRWAGITVDECDNIFVGTPTGVKQYDTTFTVVNTLATSDTVYDVRLAPANLLYVCGKSFAQSFQLSLASCTTSFSVTATAAGSCAGQGSATVTVTGGTAPYTYSWNPSGQTTAVASGLFAGTYTVTVADNSFCVPKVQTATVTVTSGGTMSVTPTQTNLQCNGVAVGSATVTATGGTGPFSYAWAPAGGSAAIATGLAAGTYTVTVADATGCLFPQIITITQPAAILVAATSTSTTCTGNTGTAIVNASGGIPGYSYSWNNGQTTSTATGLAGGTYSVTVTDANNCTQTQTVSVTSGGGFTANSTFTQTGCSSSTGTASANPTGGTAPYSYNWNNGQTSQIATGLAAGSYTATITDANGCTVITTVSVTSAPGPTASASATAATISLGNTTSLSVTGGGTYQWSPASGLSCTTCSNPVAGPTQTTQYCVTVTDVNSCSDSACITVYVDIPCGAIYLPNAFSPNDDAENDLECVMGNCVEEMHLYIYDRWGELVFETSDQATCWDGRYKGELEKTGVYGYYLTAILKNGTLVNTRGNITLLR